MKTKIGFLLSFAPWVFIAIFVPFVLRAYFQLGYWPTYGNPDPKHLAFDFHYLLALYSLFFAVYAALFYFLLSIFFRQKWFRELRAFGFAWLLISFMALPQLGLIEWLLD